MPTMASRMAAFKSRVRFSETAFLSGDDDGRAFDNCFEMHDGAFVVTALMRKAADDPALMAAIRSHFGMVRDNDWCWPKTAARHQHIPDRLLPKAAATAQIEAEWEFVHIFMPQLEAARHPDAARYKVARSEGPERHEQCIYATSLREATQTVKSWSQRTLMGVPYHSLFASIEIASPDGASYRL